ncbi:MAG: sugar ABC transporter substrate-binding protein [Nitrospinota bacterium]|nr:MAG: sugar ABC transporter substrate-binding protein [Nitrospinota bacterium]
MRVSSGPLQAIPYHNDFPGNPQEEKGKEGKKMRKRGSGPWIDRRAFLRTGSLLGAGLALSILSPGAGLAQEKKLRFLTPEADPAQIEVWKKLFAAFARQKPGVRVEGEFTKWDDIVKKLATDIAVRRPPELVVGGSQPSFTYEHFKRGYLKEMSDVVEAIGRENLDATALGAWNVNGKQIAIPYGSQGPVLWYRKDILEEKGLKPPVTWEDYLEVAEKTTDPKKGIYGAVFPYGRTWNTDIQVYISIWSNGGFIFDEKLRVVFDSPETRGALKYYKEMARFSPPDAGTYGFREASNAFVSGRSVTTFYWGRVLSHLHRSAPELVSKSGAVPIPRSKITRTALHHDEVFLYKTPNTAEAVELVKLMFSDTWLKQILWTVPGHVIPTKKSLLAIYLEHPWLKESPDIAKTLSEVPTYGVSAVKESPNHPFNYKWAAVTGNRVIADCIQRIIIGKESIPKAVAWAHKRMVEVTKDIKG